MKTDKIDPVLACKVLTRIIDARHSLSRLLIKAAEQDRGLPAVEAVGHVTALHSFIRTVDDAIWGDEGKGGVIIRELDRGSDAGNP